MPTLKVSGIDNPGIARKDSPLVDVPERPVVISSRHQIFQLAGRVVVVVSVSRQRRVQNSDVDVPLEWGWVGRSKVFCDWTWLEALAVDCDAHWQIVEADRLWLSVTQYPCVPRQIQGAGNLVVGVVITLLDDDANSLFFEPCKLITEKHRDLHIRAIVVIEITRKYNERDLLLDAQIDHALEGVAGRSTHSRDLRDILQGERLKGAVQMNIGCVNEFHIRSIKMPRRVMRGSMGNPIKSRECRRFFLVAHS